MKERPILFSGPMVRALLNGTKTQTRRAWRTQPPPGVRVGYVPGETRCPYGQPGDRLWVRERWNTSANVLPPISDPYIYGADLGPTGVSRWAARWKPSIHMPRAASRITLEVTGVRVERAQDISEADAMAEGIMATRGGYCLADGSHFHCTDPRISYWSLLDAINGLGFVESNPWLWAVEFRRAAAQIGKAMP